MGLPLERIEGKYDIVAKLREGGMGAVYTVRHRLLDELRVVKVLRTQLAGNRQLEDRFVREARAAIRLRHPNVVQIFDFSLDDEGHGFLVMEYIRGLDLQQIVGRGDRPLLPIALVLEIARQSLRALGFLHRRGFVHRDVSPDNLMLTRDVDERPLVKMIDLGIAKERGNDTSLTATGVFLGKFRYSSPEQFGADERAGVDERSDLYSFGIVLYQLLTHRFPIAGTTTSQLIGGHLLRPPLPFATSDPEGRVPAELRDLVLRCLEKKAGDRFASAAELETAIAGLQEHHPLGDADLELAHRLVGLVHEGSSLEVAPGSTQDRLDAGFGAETTPEPTPSPAATATYLRAAPTPAQRLDDHLRRACELTDRGDDAAAVDELERALAIRPDNATVAGLLREARERLDERHSTSLVAEVLRDLEALVAESRLFEADRLLFQAEESHGAHPLLADFRDRLAARHHQELEARLRTALDEATAAHQAGDLLRARLLVAHLLERHPDHVEARRLARQLDGRKRA